jgi:hypothetical protein
MESFKVSVSFNVRVSRRRPVRPLKFTFVRPCVFFKKLPAIMKHSISVLTLSDTSNKKVQVM